MRHSPSIVPNPDDREIYLLLNDFGGRLPLAWCETDEEHTDRETVITDLITGQYSDPVRVVAFNTAEGWSRDVSEKLADEIAEYCANKGLDVPELLDRYSSGRPVQLPLPLRGAV